MIASQDAPRVAATAMSHLSLIHCMGHVHGAIRPLAIYISPTTGEASLLGATTASRDEGDRRLDIWSLGVTLLYMQSGCFPFPHLASYFSGSLSLSEVYSRLHGVSHGGDGILSTMASRGGEGAVPFAPLVTAASQQLVAMMPSVCKLSETGTLRVQHLPQLLPKIKVEIGTSKVENNSTPAVLQRILTPSPPPTSSSRSGCPARDGPPARGNTTSSLCHTFDPRTKVIQCPCGLPLFSVVPRPKSDPCSRCRKRAKDNATCLKCACKKFLCRACVLAVTEVAEPTIRRGIVTTAHPLLTTIHSYESAGALVVSDTRHNTELSCSWSVPSHHGLLDIPQPPEEGGHVSDAASWMSALRRDVNNVYKFEGGVLLVDNNECWVAASRGGYLRCRVDVAGHIDCHALNPLVWTVYPTDTVERCSVCPHADLIEGVRPEGQSRAVYLRWARRTHASLVVRLSNGCYQVEDEEKEDGETYRGVYVVAATIPEVVWYRGDRSLGGYRRVAPHVASYLNTVVA